MSFFRPILARIAALFRKRELDTRIDEEMLFHLEMQIEENMRRGMTPQEARRQARIASGGLEQAKELHRESRAMSWLDGLVQDVRYGVRTLRRDSALTIFAILIVGFGVGAGSTVFSVVQALLLRPLPFEEPERLVWIANGDSLNLSAQTVQVNNLLDLREQSTSFAGMAAFSPFYGAGDIRLNGVGEPERLTAVPVTQSFFPLLGVQPRVGRFFTPQECLQNASKTVVLSYRFWQRRFLSDPNVAGQSILLDGDPATIVGVAPESFDFPGIFSPGTRADLFQPFPLSPEKNRQGNTLALIGRLKSGADLRSAQAEAAVIAARIESSGDNLRTEGHQRNGFYPLLSPLRERVSGNLRTALLALSGAVGFLLLLVCVNLSNLLLARASARHKEMAIRAALGAGRRRLIRQVLIESLMLSGCGAVLGLVLAIGGTQLLSNIQGASIPLLQNVRVDGAGLTFTLLAAVFTGIVFGLAPALQGSSADPQAALEESSRGSTGGLGRSRLRGTLVICEIALACVLLTGAGLLLRSLNRALHVELGFDEENVMALRADPGKEYSTREQRNGYFDEILGRLRATPGVEAAGLTDALPFGDNYGWRTWDAAGAGNDERQFPLVRIIDDGYFSAMKIPLRAGRAFTSSDDPGSDRVIIVNEPLAAALWPDQDPLGKLLQTNGREYRVIGVVSEVRYFGLERSSGPEMYIPIRQQPDYSSLDLVIRASVSPLELTSAVREVLHSVDPNLPAPEFRTMDQLVDNSVFARRFVVFLISGFALFGLLLAALGIFALISYSVNQRKQEIGIRMALGASAANLQTGILLETCKLGAAGLSLGMLGSWMAACAIQGLLFEVPASDLATFVSVLLLLAASAAVAGYLPARRASRLNPLDALRAD